MTLFEEKVYKAVCRIPRGKVRSYKQIAEEIGSPGAYRAVGNALNKNPYIGQVSCHRVIRSNGTAGGFQKGAQLKLRLLEKEGVFLRCYKYTENPNIEILNKHK